jgi:hypothetical protein
VSVPTPRPDLDSVERLLPRASVTTVIEVMVIVAAAADLA